MKGHHVLFLGLIAAAVSFSGNPAFAEADVSANASHPQFFVGIKPWATTWDIPLVDTTVALTNSGPVLRQTSTQVTSNVKIVPIFSAGTRYKNFVLAANYFPNTSYSTEGMTDGRVKRNEWDISVGYAFTPNILASLAYKRGKISQVLTSNSSALYGVPVGYTIEGWLLGVNASAPLQDRLSLYGNLAVGPARDKGDIPDNAGVVAHNGFYKIGEVGFSYRLSDQPNSSSMLNNVSLQVGYRSQTISIRNLAFGTLDSNAPYSVISYEKHDVVSTTQGFIVGLIGAF